MENKKRHLFKRFRVLNDPFSVIFFSVMVIFVLSYIIPTAWVLISSLKDRMEFRLNRFGLPEKPTLNNFKNVFDKLYIQISSAKVGTKKVFFPELFTNGLLYAVITTLIGLVLNTFAAYGCTKFNSRVGKILMAYVIFQMTISIAGTAATTMTYYKNLHVYDNFLFVAFANGGWGGGGFLIMCATFGAISKEYSEAAYIDGASHWTVFFKVILPMVSTTLVALFITGFIGYWNDYTTPMLYLPSMPTIAYGLYRFRFSSDSLVSAIPMQLTACIVVMFPILILFILFKNKIMGNLTIGGIKG